MDHDHLRKFFPLHPTDDPEILDAQQKLRESANDLALTINKLMQDSPAKQETLMRLFQILRDVHMSIELDGVSRVKGMVVMN